MEKPLVVPADSNQLSRMKWEYEEDRTGRSDLLCMGTADMDFKSPQPVLDAMKRVLDRGHLGYPFVREEYYEIIQTWLKRIADWDINAETCVLNHMGIYLAAWNAIHILTEAKERIVILTPVHFCFKKMITTNDRIAVECPLIQENGRYTIDYQALEACLKSDAKLLWINNPHNPVGHAWTREELEKIGRLCLENGVYILSDDVYCGLVFPGYRYTPIASISKEISYQTVTLYSTSKSYNTTGIRHAFAVIENPVIFQQYVQDLEKSDLTYGMNLMGIEATMAALSQCDAWTEELIKKMEHHYQLVCEAVALNMPGAKVTKADATYFAWIDMRSCSVDGRQLSYLIESEEHLIVENGWSGGKGGNGFIRMNLATSEKNVKEGMKRLAHFWNHHLR